MSKLLKWDRWQKLFQAEYLVFVIVILGLFLRCFQLGQVPHGLTWDEAAVGYNGYAVVTTRRDEWLHRLPISFRSFGDYKAPFAIYLNGIFTTVLGLGLEPWAIRLPFALSGGAAVLGLIFLTRELLKFLEFKNPDQTITMANLAGLWLAISPWHIHFTRTGFESGLAVTILIWASWITLRAIQTKSWFLWLTASVAWILSLYAYHSAKIVTPLILLGFLIWQAKNLWNQRKALVWPIALGIVLLLPLVKDALVGDGLTRAGTLLFSRATSMTNFFELLWQNILAQDSLSFWLQGGTTTLRHSDGQTGVIYWPDLIAIAVAVFGFGWNRFKRLKFGWWDKLCLIGGLWSVIGLLPAILASETPHPNRAFLAIVGVGGLTLAGWSKALNYLNQRHKFNWLLLVGIAYFGSLCLYQWHYYTDFKSRSAVDFFDGYLEAAELAVKFEKNPPNNQEVDKILFTDYYGQPYIFVLLARKTNPIWYQGGGLIKYEFTSKINTGDLDRNKTLVIASPTDDILDAKKPDQLIYGSDGLVKFKVFYPKTL